MLQVLEHQQHLANVRVFGDAYIPSSVQTITFKELLTIAKSNSRVVFHARRNDEMIQALITKKLFGAKNLKIVFTSTAQRHHSKFTKWLMQQMDSVISTCQAAAQYIDPTLVDAIIPHGVDTERYFPSENKKEAFTTIAEKFELQAKYGIGVFGRVRSSKGIDLVIEAATKVLPDHPEWGLLICGECLSKDETFQEELKVKIKAANLADRIKFIGKQPFNDLPDLYRALHLIIAASRNEGFGLTPLEAMASGTAVLTSHAGAWAEIVKPEFGQCFKTGDAEDLGSRLDHMLQSPTTCAQQGVHARTKAVECHQAQLEAQLITQHLLSLAES